PTSACRDSLQDVRLQVLLSAQVKGKPVVRRGRKASGLEALVAHQDSGVAGGVHGNTDPPSSARLRAFSHASMSCRAALAEQLYFSGWASACAISIFRSAESCPGSFFRASSGWRSRSMRTHPAPGNTTFK